MAKPISEEITQFSNGSEGGLSKEDISDRLHESSEHKHGEVVKVSVDRTLVSSVYSYAIAVPKGYKILYCVNDTQNRPVLKVNSTPMSYFVVDAKSAPYCATSFRADEAPALLTHTAWIGIPPIFNGVRS